MKTRKKRIETVTETTTLLILKNSNIGARADWCERCAAEVFWVAPAAAAAGLFGISDLPEKGAVHTNGAEICARSLIEQINKGEKK